MRSSEVAGLPVISIADGERLGTVARVYVDPAAKRVVGFAYEASPGIFSPDSAPRVDAERIRSLGPDALTLDDRDAVRGEGIDTAIAALTTLDELAGREVLTRGGAALGRIAGASFDERSFGLTELEVARGLLVGTWAAPIGQVLTIGRDYVIVADGIWEDDAENNKPATAPGGAG